MTTTKKASRSTVQSYVFTRAMGTEWPRCEPSSRISAGECIRRSVGGEKGDEKGDERTSHRVSVHRGGGNVATMCDGRGESWSFFLGSCDGIVHTFVVHKGQGNARWRLLSPGNLAPGKLGRDNGSPPVATGANAQSRKAVETFSWGYIYIKKDNILLIVRQN